MTRTKLKENFFSLKWSKTGERCALE